MCAYITKPPHTIVFRVILKLRKYTLMSKIKYERVIAILNPVLINFNTKASVLTISEFKKKLFSNAVI